MEIRKLNHDEVAAFRALLDLFKEVFGQKSIETGDHHLLQLLDNTRFMVFVVWEQGQVVGGATVYLLDQYYSEKPLAYLYDLGISPAFQGRGFGRAVVAHICRHCLSHGFEAMYVEAEADDHQALDFYRKTPFTYETAAIHFTYSLQDKE